MYSQMDEFAPKYTFSCDFEQNDLVDQSYFGGLALTRKQVVGNYLNRLGAFEQESANMTAAELRDSDKPLASTTVLIPVAAHQEAHNIENAVNQYANQQTSKPFSVLLYPNAPMDSDQDAVGATMDEMEKAKKAHPELDIRYTSPNLYDKPTIGTIRRDLWNAALLLAHYEGAFDDPTGEVVGINHDIDVVRQSPRNIGRIQKRYERVQAEYNRLNIPGNISRPHSSFVKHSYDPEHPNASRAVFWHDFTYWQVRPRGAYDAGLVLPFSYYADRNGIAADANTYEMKPMTKDKQFYVIPGTLLETSPRRFHQRLHTANLGNIWMGTSFGANDVCRTEDLPDIDNLRLQSIVRQSLQNSMVSFFTRPFLDMQEMYDMYGLSPNEHAKEAITEALTRGLHKKKRLAMSALTRVMDLPSLAEMVDKEYDSDYIARKTVENGFTYLPI